MEQTPAKHCKMKKGAGERQREAVPPERSLSLSQRELSLLGPLSLLAGCKQLSQQQRRRRRPRCKVPAEQEGMEGERGGRGAFSLFVGIGGEQRSDR